AHPAAPEVPHRHATYGGEALAERGLDGREAARVVGRGEAAAVAIADGLHASDDAAPRRDAIALERLVRGVDALAAGPAERLALRGGERLGLEQRAGERDHHPASPGEQRRVAVGRDHDAI